MEKNIIHGYKLLAPFDSKNAGFCRWTFGTRDGQVYFLKEFNDPVYPDETTLSPNLRQARVRECEEFEDQKVKLYHRINQFSDGNLVRSFELFRLDSHYYLATRKIQGVDMSLEEVAQLPLQDRLLLCRSAAHALMQLHRGGIVHADIKQSNVILQKTVTGKIVAKIIDFDASFFEDEAPEEEDELHFDQAYLSPEGGRFMNGEPVELTCKMDVFAMGLLMHEYLTGKQPRFGAQYDAAYEAVLDEQVLHLDPTLPPKVAEILRKMLRPEPEERCTMEEVFTDLGEFFGCKPEVPQEKTVEVKAPEIPKDPKPENNTVKGPMNEFFSNAGDL